MVNNIMKDRIRNLINNLNEAAFAYEKGTPFITDEEYDEMWYELKKLEEETGIIYNDSPVSYIPYQVVTELKKVTHNHPMLSLDKTKDLTTVESFLKGHDWIAMSKMDGLTCSLRYIDGKLISAETRGNGIIGEDITHNAMIIPSIPKIIPYKEEMIIDGEIICTYKDFEQFKDNYKNPRNFAAGSIRLLDSKECAKRNLTFVVWDVIKGGPYKYLSQNLAWAFSQGFVVTHFFINKDTPLNEVIDIIKKCSKTSSYPIDGVVFKYDNIEEYDEAGRTDHHFKGGLAYKFYDEIYETNLKNIKWTMGRTGVLTPVAIFDPVDIDGSIVEKASLHNVSIMHKTLGDCAYIGEPLQVAKMNMIIPQITEAGPKYNYEQVIEHKKTPANYIIENCPYCGHPISYKKSEGNVINAYCENKLCEGKLINKLDHFCGKKGLDIKGLSKATLEKLINWEWVNSITDIFKLYSYQSEWIKKPGFGQTSVSKIINAIEKAKDCSFDQFLCALGIPLIGKVASKSLMNTFGDYKTFRTAIEEEDERLYQIDGIGEVMINVLLHFDYTEADIIFEKYIREVAAAPVQNDSSLMGKTFCITGKLKTWKNRDELKSFIESKGGKVTGSVTSKTSYLVNNDIASESSKNVTAKRLGIPIINEEELVLMSTT